MDFNNVPPVDVKVRDLSLSIESSPSVLERLHIRKGQLHDDKRILENVSLDVPSGSLMAIIGASGSGRVFASVVSVVDEDVIVKFDGASNSAGANEDERQGGV
jgi:ABC-type transporter Mla maintaining outer membrane lipid asymmetry ATPase subunit MlaF